MELKLLNVFIWALFFNTEVIASASGGQGDSADEDPGTPGTDNKVTVYCAKECVSDDSASPCEDSKGQSSQCLSVTYDAATNFGFDENFTTETFMGCTHTVCETACSGMDSSKKMNIVDGTFCFPKMSEMNDMFMTEDMAKMAAVSRGCEGAHAMSGSFMIGDNHSDCMGSYSKSGKVYGSGIDESNNGHSDGDGHDHDHGDMDGTMSSASSKSKHFVAVLAIAGLVVPFKLV